MNKPRHNVNNKLITVKILKLNFTSYILTFPEILTINTLNPESPTY